MHTRISARTRVLAAMPLLLSLCVWSNAAVGEAAATTTFSGQATAVQATLVGLPRIALADTGPLPPAGGARDASLLTVGLLNTLNADVAHATTIGQADRSESEAALADLNLKVGADAVSAGFLMSHAKAVCAAAGPYASGSAEVAKMAVNGQPIYITGSPNQQVPLPDGRVILNEQSPDSATGSNQAGVTVNALHVIVNNVADIIISSAHADVSCPPAGTPPTCTGDDFMTGSGSMTTSSGARANFAVAGGFTNGKYWGHVLFINHGSGKQWKSTSMTAYGPGATPGARHMEGSDDENGRAGTFKDDAEDNNPSGADRESFQSDDGENDSGNLDDGDMHHHSPCKDD